MAGLLKRNLEAIQDIIERESNKQSLVHRPRLIAVSKKQSIEKIQELYDLGLKHFAENYLQEAMNKIEALQHLNINWHFIGKIQSKKIKDIVGNFELIHTVSRMSEVEGISKVAGNKGLIQKILVQVNIADEESKQGFSVAEILEAIKAIQEVENILLKGLMVFPPLSENEVEVSLWFQKSKKLFDQLRERVGESFDQLSMGTSDDFHLAIRSGATDLRVGSRLMGPRDQ